MTVWVVLLWLGVSSALVVVAAVGNLIGRCLTEQLQVVIRWPKRR